jgi:hypothetical protein
MSSADTTITVELVPDHYAFMLACVGDTTPEAVTRFIRLAIEALMLELGGLGDRPRRERGRVPAMMLTRRLALSGAVLIVSCIATGVATWHFTRGPIMSKEDCAQTARERGLLLRDFNTTFTFESAQWNAFGKVCLAGYWYEVTRRDRITIQYVVFDLQTGQPVFNFDTGRYLSGNITAQKDGRANKRRRSPGPITML